jgi:CBS domain containing-hemolysin-like protein
LEGLGLDALMVLLALFLVALNGLFVAAEFGLVPKTRRDSSTSVSNKPNHGETSTEDELLARGLLGTLPALTTL